MSKKVTLISTVLNEAGSLDSTMQSIKAQTRRPDEIIFVDGGSSDATVAILKKWKKKLPQLRILVRPRANIAQGRNIAIRAAKYSIIASMDGGCVLSKLWLRELTKPLEGRVKATAGVYIPRPENDFERFQGEIIRKDPSKIDSSAYLPQAGALAFRKEVWKEIGGFSEELYAGEDTKFDLEIVRRYGPFKLARKARVHWKMRPTWRAFAKQMYLYGKGDRQAGNLKHLPLTQLFVWGSLAAGIAIVLAGLLYRLLFYLALLALLIYSLYKGAQLARTSRDIKGLFYGPPLFLTKRIAYLIGYLSARQ